jgi:hypothetical protein
MFLTQVDMGILSCYGTWYLGVVTRVLVHMHTHTNKQTNSVALSPRANYTD